ISSHHGRQSMYTHLEEDIIKLYRVLSIDNPANICMETIANKLNINLIYGIASFRLDNEIIIKPSNSKKEWQDFGHEISHWLRHVGNQLNMHFLFRDLQEYQADYFAYHFCVPTF